MDFDRRGLLWLAGATAATLAVSRSGRAKDGETTILLHARPTTAAIDAQSPLSYGKLSEAPVVRVPKDAIVHFRLLNGLAEMTALDWHGLRIGKAFEAAPGFDGILLASGGETTIDVRPPESGTVWFHPPYIPGWSNQTARGLSGVLVVEERAPPFADDDLVLLLGDRLDAKGLDLSEMLSINRKAWPETRTYAPGSRVRLRLVNGSTRKAVSATFEGARPMVIAIDGQPSELFQPLNDALPVGPGARFDIMIDLPKRSANAEAVFKLKLGSVEGGAQNLAMPMFVVNLGGAVRPDLPPIAPLAPNASLPRVIPLEQSTRAELTVRKANGQKPGSPLYAINGSSFMVLPKAPLFSAKRDTAVTLGFTNRTQELIGFRLHGQTMRLLHSLDDGWEPYWRDSILVPPGKTFHAAFLANTPGRWLIESPFFDQATAGLRHWFEIR